MNARLPLALARALAPMAPPQSEVHQIIEADALAADRARNERKAERAEAYAMRLDRDYQDAMDAANAYGSGRGTL